MQSILEKELECLQEQNIITPVQFSEWEASVVPVVKCNGEDMYLR